MNAVHSNNKQQSMGYTVIENKTSIRNEQDQELQHLVNNTKSTIPVVCQWNKICQFSTIIATLKGLGIDSNPPHITIIPCNNIDYRSLIIITLQKQEEYITLEKKIPLRSMWSSYFSLFPQVFKSALQVFMSLLHHGVIRLRMLLQPLPTNMRTSERALNNAPSSNTCLHCKEQTKCSTYNKINNRQEWRIKMQPEWT